MRAACILATLLAVAACTAAMAGELPDINNSTVSIPWADFKEILNKLQQQGPIVEPEPPVPYALGRGTLTGTLADGRLELTTTYPLSVLKKGWVMCPLVDTSAPVASVMIDGATAPVTDVDGSISLVVRGPATHTLTMRFEVIAPMRPGPGSVSLQLPQAAGQVLTMKIGPKLAGVTVDGATMSQDRDNQIAAILTSDHLTIRYTVATEVAEAQPERLEPKVLVENSTLVSIDEGFVRAVVQLAYEVRHAPVSEFTLIIPAGFDVADCTGDSLVRWALDEASRVLTAVVGFEVKGAYNLTVVLERSTKEASFSFPLPAVEAVAVEREHGFFAVQVTGGVEVTPGDELKGLQIVDAKELPAGLRSGATNPIVLSFKYLRHPFSAELKVVRHETQPVLGAAIDSASYVMQVTEDGDCVTRAVYTVRNNRKQFLELTLPQGRNVALWSSFVADKPVRPSKTSEGRILLPLEKSSYAGSELGAFTVEVIYYSNLGSDLGTVGSVDLTMPEVDLPISRSVLTVFAPARFRYSRTGGSMREPYVPPIRTGLAGLALLERSKDMAAPEEAGEARSLKPTAKSEVGVALEEMDRTAGLDLRQAEAEQVFRKRIRAAQDAQDVSGALPARFEVPQEGTAMRFQETITMGEASSLELVYLCRKIDSALAFLALAVTAVLAWSSTRLVAEPASRRKGHMLFALGAVAIVALVAGGAPTSYVVVGAVIGLAARLVRWVALRAVRTRQ